MPLPATLDHVGRNVARRFGGYDQPAAPAGIDPGRQQRTRQAHAGHHVGLPVAFPGGVVGLEEVLRAEDAGVVDQDVDLGQAGQQRFGTGRIREVSRDTKHMGTRYRGEQVLACAFNAVGTAAVEDHRGPGRGQALRDRQADAGGGGGDQCGAAAEFDLHGDIQGRGMPQYRSGGVIGMQRRAQRVVARGAVDPRHAGRACPIQR
ncbi:hypothetical protein G6F35_008060 [Rhizopus arrhizus]|nr:hypothetical protein G6F35_008060 [Rhizopus arrhizus]